jgi:hypothetical protein
MEKSPTKLEVVIGASISGDMIQNDTTQTDYTFTSLKYLLWKKGIYLRAHCHFDSVGQFFNTPQHQDPGLDTKLDVLSSIVPAPGQAARHLLSITPTQHISTRQS